MPNALHNQSNERELDCAGGGNGGEYMVSPGSGRLSY